VAVDANTTASTGAKWYFIDFPETDLTGGTTYAISVQPSTANSLGVANYSVASAAHFQAHPSDVNSAMKTRTNGGSWSALTTTQRLYVVPVYSRFDNGAGGGSGISRSRVQGGM